MKSFRVEVKSMAEAQAVVASVRRLMVNNTDRLFFGMQGLWDRKHGEFWRTQVSPKKRLKDSTIAARAGADNEALMHGAIAPEKATYYDFNEPAGGVADDEAYMWTLGLMDAISKFSDVGLMHASIDMEANYTGAMGNIPAELLRDMAESKVPFGDANVEWFTTNILEPATEKWVDNDVLPRVVAEAGGKQ